FVARDGSGRAVHIGENESNFKKGLDSTWSIGSANVRWLPNLKRPEQAAIVTASPGVLREGGLVVLSVHDLAKTGLDIHHVASVEVDLKLSGPARVQLSPLYRMKRGGQSVADREPPGLSYSWQ